MEHIFSLISDEGFVNLYGPSDLTWPKWDSIETPLRLIRWVLANLTRSLLTEFPTLGIKFNVTNSENEQVVLEDSSVAAGAAVDIVALPSPRWEPQYLMIDL